jgi:hypothetical protein
MDRYADLRVVMRDLFSFPNPVNETSARLVAGVVARALTGPKLSPLALVATRVVTPRLHVTHRYSPGPAKRFAQSIGAVFTVSASVLWFAAGQHTAALVLAGIIALFASLESGFGLCVGCKAFYLGMRLGLVPPSVCEDCAPFLT